LKRQEAGEHGNGLRDSCHGSIRFNGPGDAPTQHHVMRNTNNGPGLLSYPFYQTTWVKPRPSVGQLTARQLLVCTKWSIVQLMGSGQNNQTEEESGLLVTISYDDTQVVGKRRGKQGYRCTYLPWPCHPIRPLVEVIRRTHAATICPNNKT
jgi:hypothetical protein